MPAWKHLPLLVHLVLISPVLCWQSSRLFGQDVAHHGHGTNSRLFARAQSKQKRHGGDQELRHYTITYSPNFNRHLVSYRVGKRESGKKTAVKSFLWLDEALQAYPNATLDPLDLPPPFPSTQEPLEGALLLSRVVAGAGPNETSVYYNDNRATSEVLRGSPAMNPNNGGTYLYRFLQKLYTALPTAEPAQIHSFVLDKFPRIAFYDAALVHERLFFLLSPLPPSDVLENLRMATQVKATKRNKLIADSTNASACFDDFPLLFYKYGYGAGLTKFQLAQALQSLPQYWLPIYLGDALASTRKPQDVVPYILVQLNSHPDINDAVGDLDHLLTGTTWSDVASLAHAKSSLKLTGDQCHILLHAFPTLRTSDTEPNWELFRRGPVRPVLMEESLAYLRIRLQLDPVQIFSLIKTHTRLSSYTAHGKLKPILDALQRELDLQSKELQQLILRMPSLLGMSVSGLVARKHFFLVEVGMTPEQLKKSVLKLPALIQYSILNLKSKLGFFQEDLRIHEHSVIVKMLVTQPVIWGLSTEHNLKPTAASLGDYFGLSSREVGQLISHVPELVLFNWKNNLEPKLRFLIDRLELAPPELKSLVMSSPRILTYSLRGALSSKIDMLEEYLLQHRELDLTIKDLLLQRPSLLITSKNRLIERLNRGDAFTKEAERGEGGRGAGVGTSGRKRRVLELSLNGTILREFPSVTTAAASAGTSVSNMYSVLRQGRSFRERRYCKGEPHAELLHSETEEDTDTDSNKPQESAGTSSSSHVIPVSTKGPPRLSVFVAGRVYPPNDSLQARGARRVGGMVVAMPSLCNRTATLFKQALQDCYGAQLLRLEACQIGDDQDGLVALIGYTNFEASRRRCSLYACFVSLRILAQFLVLQDKASKQQPRGSARPLTKTHIDVVTDSSYTFELLQNKTKLWEWGASMTPEEFVYTGKGTKWFANTDILHGLSCAYRKLVDPQGALSSKLRTNITTSFLLDTEETTPMESSEFREQMDCWGKEAAKLFYDRCHPYQVDSAVSLSQPRDGQHAN